MATVADLLRRIRNQLHDTDPTFYRWSDEELIDLINAACREIVYLVPEANVIEEIFVPPNRDARQELPEGAVKFIKCISNYRDLQNTTVVRDSLEAVGSVTGGLLKILLTTPPYPYETQDDMTASLSEIGAKWGVHNFDTMSALGGVTGGSLRDPLVTYDNWPPDEIVTLGALLSGSLRDPLRVYEDWPPDETTASGTLTGGSLRAALVTYDNWPPDEMTTTGGITGGTLT
jgi:hypothetical protein